MQERDNHASGEIVCCGNGKSSGCEKKHAGQTARARTHEVAQTTKSTAYREVPTVEARNALV